MTPILGMHPLGKPHILVQRPLCLLLRKCHHHRTGFASNSDSQLGTTCQHMAPSRVSLSSTAYCSGPSSPHPCSLLSPGPMLSTLGTTGQKNEATEISIRVWLPTDSTTTIPTAFPLILEAGQHPGQIPQPMRSGCQGSNPRHITPRLCDLGADFFISSVLQLPHQQNGIIFAFTS